MLIKLYKYDMKSIIRQILPIWMLAPVLSVFFALSIRTSNKEFIDSENGIAEYFLGDAIIPIILGFVLFGVFIAIIVLTILFIVQRFWKGLLGDEGYLMFTLPVKPRDLIISKTLSSLTITALSLLDAFISFTCIVAVFEGGFVYLKEFFSLMFEDMRELLKGLFIPFMILLALSFIAGIIENIYRIYVSMAIGQLFINHRIAASVIAYMIIGVILNIISTLLFSVISLLGVSGFINEVNRFNLVFNLIPEPGVIFAGLIISLICSVIVIIAFHVATGMIFKKKLNLL